MDSYEQACPHKIPDDGGDDDDDDDDDDDGDYGTSMTSLSFVVNYKTRASTKKRTNDNVIIIICPFLWILLIFQFFLVIQKLPPVYCYLQKLSVC